MNDKIILTAKVKKEEKTLKKVLKKENLVSPHPSLGFFHFIYSPIEDANGNGVRLSEKAVEKSIKQLRGTQANINHERLAGCGAIVDAWVNKNDEIEIVVSFFKNLFPKEYKEAIELAKKGKLFVSFELCTDPKTVEKLADGTRRLHDIEWEGVGILMNVKPAYSNARILETAMKIIEDTFNQEDKQLVYASTKDIIKKWTKIGELIEKALTEKGDNTMDKKAQEALLAKFREDVIAELGEEAVKNWSDEQWEAELQKRASAVDETESKATDASEEKAEESKDKKEENDKEVKKSEDKKVEESKDIEEAVDCECVDCGKVIKSSEHCKDIKCSECGGEMRRKDRPGKGTNKASEDEVKDEESKSEKTTIVTEDKIKIEQTYDDEIKKETTKTEAERVVKRDGKTVVEEKVNREVTYTYAQMEEIKAEYDKQLEEKDKEIAFLKENAKKVVEIRAELGDFVKDLSDEDLIDESKLENARLKKRVHELENKDVETASDKEEEKEDLKTGHEEVDQKEEETADERVGNYLKSKYGKK